LAGHVFAVKACCDLDLQGSSLNVALDTSSHYGDHSCEKVFKSTKITKLWAGNNFAKRSCCDLDLQGSDPNVARDMSCQYGDQLCEIILKSDFKLWAIKILLKAQMLHPTRRLNMVIISVQLFRNLTSNNKVMGRT